MAKYNGMRASDRLLSGQDFLVMTGRYENFFRAQRLFWVVSKSYEREGENNKKYRQKIKLSLHKLKEKYVHTDPSLSDGESRSENEILFVFFLRIAPNRTYTK